MKQKLLIFTLFILFIFIKTLPIDPFDKIKGSSEFTLISKYEDFQEIFKKLDHLIVIISYLPGGKISNEEDKFLKMAKKYHKLFLRSKGMKKTIIIRMHANSGVFNGALTEKLPSIIVIYNGTVVETLEGDQSFEKIIKFIQRLHKKHIT
jgi:hypothetical protein